MRRPSMPTEAQVFRLGAAFTGVVMMVSAALAADFAREHMLAIGTICGAGPHPHCGWCFGAAGLVLAGLAAFYVALEPVGAIRKAGLFQIKAGRGQA